MLVYANSLTFHGPDAESAVFRAVGGWLKEQLGYGLRPEHLQDDGTFEGRRGTAKSWLQIRTTKEGEPKLFSWVLKHAGEPGSGRQWIVEAGMKCVGDSIEASCAVRTDEVSTLVAASVNASQPRVVRYIANNIMAAPNAEFDKKVPGLSIKTVGPTKDTYRGLLADIERTDRDYPIVLVSPTRDGEFLINTKHLQEELIGLAQVVRIDPEFNSYEMEEILGHGWSAWSGAVNVLYTPTPNGFIKNRLSRSEVIEQWGDNQHDRIANLLGIVTHNTNVPHLRKQIRSDGVVALAVRRRLQKAKERRDGLGAEELKHELEEASRIAEEQEELYKYAQDENERLESNIGSLNATVDNLKRDIIKKKADVSALRAHLASADKSPFDAGTERLLGFVTRNDQPTPAESLDLIEEIFADRCVVLDSAKESALESNRFVHGRQLLDMLKVLVTDYRTTLLERGDSEARKVFGKNNFAATESETVIGNKTMRRARTFDYLGTPIEMFHHLKINVEDDVTKTIRVHFHWDAERTLIVIGYCGKHLPVPSH